MTTLDRLQTGAATIGGNPDFDDGPWTVHGVAQAAEVTEGVSGERRYWPPDVLRGAAEQLVGTPVVDPSDHEDLTPAQPDPTTIIGEVVDAAFDPEREALVYEAELDDPEFAKLAARGRIDVSPSVQLRDGDRDRERNATRVAEVLGYRDLAAVTEGAHASASIQLGTAEALARQFDFTLEALQRESARRPTYTDTEDAEWSTPTLDDYLTGYDALPDPGDVDSIDDLTDEDRLLIAEKSLLGTSSGDTLREVRFFPVVNPETDALNRRALGAVRSGRGAQADIPDDAEASAQQMAGELINEEFDGDVDVEAAASAGEQADNQPGGDDDPHDEAGNGEGQSTPATDWRTTMSDDLTDKERELLAAAGQKDDPVVVEAGVRERLSDNEELLDEAESADDPVVVESTEVKTLRERVTTIEDVFAEALQERTGLSDATIDAMPFEALAAEFETDEGDLDMEALTQSPEAGGGPSGAGDDSLDEDALQRIDDIKTKLDHAEAALPDSRVESLRDEAASLADADDYEAAIEVL